MRGARWALMFASLFAIGNTALAFQNEATPEPKPQKKFSQAEFQKWLRKAEKGNRDAQLFVGTLYESGTGVPEDDRVAAEWYGRAANSGSQDAELKLGMMYEVGKGVPRNYAEAMKWYRKAAEAQPSWLNDGYIRVQLEGQFHVGQMYEKGLGVPQDYAEALSWYRTSSTARVSLAESKLALGRMYELGLGVTQDYREAATWYSRASGPYVHARDWFLTGISMGFLGFSRPEQLNAADVTASAETALGSLYQRGLGVPLNYEEALRLYRKATAAKNADAENNIAVMYENGEGVRQSYDEALKWYFKAAEHGSANAQIALGTSYEDGQRVKRDYLQAASWYRRAAEQGNAAGKYLLGRLLYRQLNNESEGIEWLRKSGDPRARTELSELNIPPDSRISDPEDPALPPATLATFAGGLNGDPPFAVLVNGSPEPALTVRKSQNNDAFFLLGPQDATSSGFQSGANRIQIIAKSARENLILWKADKLSLLRPPFSHSYAVVIAISKYASSDYPEAEGTVALAKVVVSQLEKQGFEVKTFFDEQATAEAIDLYLRELAPKIASNDRVIFYFCGHGDTLQGPNGKDVGYLVTYGVSRSNVPSRALPMRRIQNEYFDLLRSKHVLFLLDACFSGLGLTLDTAPTEEDLRRQKLMKYYDVELLASRGMRAIITAGRKQDKAINVNGGLFTHKFLDAIEGKADYDANGVVTLEELFCYVRTAVRQAAAIAGYEQEPQMSNPGDYGSGSFLFLYR